VRVIFSSFEAILQCQKKFYHDLAEAKDRWDRHLLLRAILILYKPG
jgi:hypothetical protein